MAKGTIKAKIEIEGASEYKESLRRIAQQEKELQSEMKKTQAQYKGTESGIEALTAKKKILEKQIEAEKQKLEVQNRMIENATNAQKKYASETEKLKKVLEDAGKETGELTEEQKKAVEETGYQAKSVEELQEAIKKSEKQCDLAGQAMSRYKTEANNTETGLINLNHQLIETGKGMLGIKDEADDTAEGIEEVGEASEESGENVNKLGDIIKANLISEAIIAGVKALAAGIKKCAEASIETGSQFEASMSQVAATMGITSEQIRNGSKDYETLEEAARKCGETTKYSASQAGEALNYLALAGYDAAKSAETLPKVLDLAAAGGMELATASDLVTDAMAALGLETSELDTYIDEMAKASQKSNTSVQQLGEATLVAAGAVNTAGMSLEDMNTALGVLANNGIKGAEGGTHLRNVILSLSAPTEKAEMALRDLGVETQDAGGNMRNLEDILGDLNSALDGMGTAEKAKAIKTIFNKTDIAAVNALLKSTNGEYDQLKKEISGAAGAAKDMAKTMNDNLKGQVTILQSNLEALGISCYKVFDEELKTGVEAASEAVQRLTENVNNGDMHTSLEKMSDALANLIENGADLAEDMLPKVIDAVTWCVENFDKIAAGIGGIVSAGVAMKVIVPIVEAAQAAWIAHTAAQEGATIAQQGLNMAMAANPIGLVVTALAALTGALMTYMATADLTKEKDQVLSKEQQKLADSAEKVATAMAKSSKSRSDDRATMETQKNMIAGLRNELSSYVDANGNVIDSQERVSVIVRELNELVPGLGLAYDETTQKINMSTEELERNTAALWKQAEAAAQQEQMTEIMKERIEIETEMHKLEGENTAAHERAAEAANAYHEAVANLKDIEEVTTYEYAAQYDELEKLRQEQIEAAQAAAELGAPYDDLQNRLNELNEEEAFLTGKLEENTNAMGAAGDAADEMADAYTSAADEINDSWTAMHDDIVKSISGQIDLFSEYEEAAAHTKEEILKNMQDQVTGVQEWSDDLKELSRKGISEGLLQELVKMGPEGAGYVKAFKEMTGAELQEASKLFEESIMIPETTLSEVEAGYRMTGQYAYRGFRSALEDGKEEAQQNAITTFKEVGKAVPEGMEEGIDENSDLAVGAAEDMADDVLEGTKNKLGVHSPSTEFADIGESIVLGMKSGVEKTKAMAVKAATDMAAEMTTATDKAVDPLKYESFGKRIGEGLVKGINSMIDEVEKAAKKMAEAAEKATKAKLEINSPSRVFEELGQYTGEGFMIGFNESMTNFSDAINSMIPDTSDINTPTVVGGNTITNNFTINGAEGQDVQEIAQAVQDILNDQYDSERMVFA